jgi:hypothetical protein
MSNPYAAPSRSTDADVRDAARPASKPLRIWIFQALLALQLAGAVAAIASFLLSPAVRTLPSSAILLGLLSPILGISVVIGLIVALQRLGSRPRVVAPVLASLWWVLSISSHLALEAPPKAGVLRSITFEDVLSPPAWIVGVVLHAGLLGFVISTWRHQPTRAYLSGTSARKG